MQSAIENGMLQEILAPLNASKKEARELIALALEALALKHGAIIEKREVPANPGYCGQGIDMHFKCNGVGAMVDIDNLHGGGYALISWFNTDRPTRNFSSRFCKLTGNARGATGCERPHHKSTSVPADWYALAMMLDAGLLLAVRGEAFEERSAT